MRIKSHYENLYVLIIKKFKYIMKPNEKKKTVKICIIPTKHIIYNYIYETFKKTKVV